MIDKENKELYKKFKYLKDPLVIRQRIKEYKNELAIIKCKNIIKNYNRNKEQIELAIIENTNNIKRIKMLREMFRHEDLSMFGRDTTIFLYADTYRELNTEINKLNWKYCWAKDCLKNHYIKNNKEE